MPIRHLINDDGSPFSSTELLNLKAALNIMSDAERIQFRNDNCTTIAKSLENKVLIVSGPGTGKSTLFKQRISYWLQNDHTAKILALSFVRKLVADLQNDIQTDRQLTDEQKKHTDVFTLHKYARRIVEKNHGNSKIKFEPHFRIITDVWKGVVWSDVLLYVGQSNLDEYSLKNYEKQLHDANFENTPGWQNLKNAYLILCKFYNATGFADLIIHARETLVENPSLNEQDYFILDEYQDFNSAEEELINQLAQQARGLLIVGDDDQVLYEKLKSGKAALIRALYRDTNFANAMLPFCGRSTFHIAKTAGHFILQSPEVDTIEKIYLPITSDIDTPKVQMIGCATPGTAVDYIKKFIEDNRPAIEARKAELANNESKDPYLLILTPGKELKFYANKDANVELFTAIAEFQQETKKFSEDYYKLLNYYSLANYPQNNFIFRKVLNYEGVSDADVSDLIKKCLATAVNFKDLSETIISSILERCSRIKAIVQSIDNIETKITNLENEISLANKENLKKDLERRAVNNLRIREVEHQEEEDAELDELEIQQMSAVELMTIVGSKGLSADHVIIIGFDDVNMSWISKNAFYVAMTRARKSLHIITALKSGGSSKPHSFISQLPDEHIEFYKYTKSDHRKTSINNRTEFHRYFDSQTYNSRLNSRGRTS